MNRLLAEAVHDHCLLSCPSSPTDWDGFYATDLSAFYVPLDPFQGQAGFGADFDPTSGSWIVPQPKSKHLSLEHVETCVLAAELAQSQLLRACPSFVPRSSLRTTSGLQPLKQVCETVAPLVPVRSILDLLCAAAVPSAQHVRDPVNTSGAVRSALDTLSAASPTSV